MKDGLDEFDPPPDDDLDDETRDELRAVLADFFDRPIERANEFDWEAFQRNEPFKAIMMPDKRFWVLANFERSFTQKLGQQMYEKFARAVATGNDEVGRAERSISLESLQISPEQRTEIENILVELEDGREPDWESERERVVNAGGAPTVSLGDLTWDLYVGEFDSNRPLLTEIKSPKPNKDQARETKRAMLQTVAAYSHRDEPTPVVALAFPFNPYGSRKDYAHWPAKRVFDIETSSGVLVADEFWDAVGGEGTMDDVCAFLVTEATDNAEKLDQIASDQTD